MVNSKIRLRDVSYARHLYKSVLGVVVLVALLVTIGTMRTSMSTPGVPVDHSSKAPGDETMASIR